MTRKDRIQLIKKIEAKRKSKVICYILGDRPNLMTNIADDAVRILYDHLEGIGKQEQIDLFLYARGGNLMAPFRMVHLIREFCNTFNVIIPYRALSAATLLSLGADEILMGKMGELSPIDPTTAHPFNPQDPANPQRRFPISVEDVTSFMAFAKKKAGLSKEKDIDVFRILTDNIHPLAIGNIERGYEIIRQIAPKLLGFHTKDKERINHVIESLTEGKVHEYLITRHEAEKEIGLNVRVPDGELESLMWGLYTTYEKDLRLREQFNPQALLGNKSWVKFSIKGAYVESILHTDAFIFEGMVTGGRPPLMVRPQPSVAGQPPTTPSKAPSRPTILPPQKQAAPPVTTPIPPIPGIVTFTFRGWRRIS